MNTNTQNTLNTIKVELSFKRDRLTEINQQIEKIQSEIEKLEEMPISLTDWGKYLKQGIKEAGAAYFHNRYSLSPLNIKRGSDQSPNQYSWGRYEQLSDTGKFFATVARLDLFPHHQEAMELLCALFPEQVYTGIMEGVQREAGEHWGNENLPSVVERKQMLSDLEMQLSTLSDEKTILKNEIANILGAIQ